MTNLLYLFYEARVIAVFVGSDATSPKRVATYWWKNRPHRRAAEDYRWACLSCL